MKKRFLALILCVLVLHPVHIFAENSTSTEAVWQYFENGAVLKINSPNVLYKGKMDFIDFYDQTVVLQKIEDEIMLPLDLFARVCQLSYSLNGDDFLISDYTNTIEGQVGSSEVKINGETANLYVPPTKQNEHVLFSLRILSKNFGYQYSQRNNFVAVGDQDLSACPENIISGLERVFTENLPVMPMAYGYAEVESIQTNVKPLMEMSEEDLISIVPPLGGGNFSVSDPETGVAISAQWSISSPHIVTDKNTGMTYPNAAYPMDKTETLLSLMGNEVEVPYYEDKNGKKYYFEGLVHAQQRKYLLTAIERMGYIYYFTQDEAYARRIALILDKTAETIPYYLIVDGDSYVSTGGPWLVNGEPDLNMWLKSFDEVTENSEIDTEPKAGSLPYSWYATRSFRRWSQEMSAEMLIAYYYTKNSGAYEKLPRGSEERKFIENNLFRNLADFPLLIPWAYHLSTNLITHINMWALTGRVIEEPKYVHLAYQYIKSMMEEYTFSREGIVPESPAYMSTYLSGLGDPFQMFMGYSDPEGYVDSFSGQHLENVTVQSHFKREYDLLETGKINYELTKYPDGSVPHVHDTNGNQLLTSPFTNNAGLWSTARDTSESILQDGIGMALLGDGEYNQQIQTFLHYSDDKITHAHNDCLNILLNAYGRQMLDDIGYNRSSYRQWQNYSLSHNTLIIDRKNQNASSSRVSSMGNIDFYDDSADGVAVVSVDGRHAYLPEPEKYKRTIIQNTIDIDSPYVIDIFEAEGGDLHDYVLHGTRASDQTVSSNISMTAMEGERPLLVEGETWVEPGSMGDSFAGEGYGAITDVTSGDATAGCVVDFKYLHPYDEGTYYYESHKKSENYLRNALVSANNFFDAYPPEDAVDGNPSTRLATRSWPATVKFDMRTIRTINSIYIDAIPVLTNYEVKVSADGSTWKTVATHKTNGNMERGAKNCTINFDDVDARYITIECTASDTGSKPSYYEVEAYYVENIEGFDRDKDVGLKVHSVPVAGNGKVTLMLGESPALKQTAQYEEEGVADIKSKLMILRREGENLKSIYVNILEPYLGESKIKKITNLSQNNEQIVLQIELEERTDLVSIRLSEEGIVQVENMLETDAQIAVVSDNGKSYMGKGSYLKVGDQSIFEGKDACYSGEVLDVESTWQGDEKNVFILEDTFPVENIQEGMYLKIKHGRCVGEYVTLQNLAYTQEDDCSVYKILSAEQKNGKIYVEVEGETGLTIEENGDTRMIFYPKKLYKGVNTFEIINSYEEE